jgi:hypothetical protein
LDTYYFQGPDFSAYADALVDTGISRIPPEGTLSRYPRYQGTIETHHDLLTSARAVMKEMVKDTRITNVAAPTMFHPDLHMRNIFVSETDPTIIAAIIDWQSTSIEPAFWYADRVPDFARPIPHPSRDGEIEPKSEACAKMYDVCTQFLMPTLAEPQLMDEAYFRPFKYCYLTWTDGAAAFREELIQTSRRWEQLGFEGSCAFPFPTLEEIALHKKDYKLFEAAHQLRQTLSQLLLTDSDGWVLAEDWEATKKMHKEMYAELVKVVLGNEEPDENDPIRTEADVREIWPFDLDLLEE